MNFSNQKFLTNSVYGSTFTTLTLFISKSCKNKENSAKTQFELVEMHINPLDPYLIRIIKRWVFDLNSLNLEVYLNTPAIVCLRIYRQVIYNGWSNDIHVRWMILIRLLIIIKKDLSYVGSVQTAELSHLVCNNFQFDVIFYSMLGKWELVSGSYWLNVFWVI